MIGTTPLPLANNTDRKISVKKSIYYFSESEDKNLIEQVGELCDKPDLEKECLLIKVADLENLKIIS